MKELQILIQTKEVLNIDAAHLSSVLATGEKVFEEEGSQTEKLREIPSFSLIPPFIERNKSFSTRQPSATVGYFG